MRKGCNVSAARTRCGLEWEKKNTLIGQYEEAIIPDMNALTQVFLEIPGKLKEL